MPRHRTEATRDVARRLAGHGLLGLNVPEQYGGGGRDEVSHVLALMEVAKGNASAGGLLVWNNSLYCFLVLRHGTEEQKRRYLPLSLSGEKPGCLVLLGDGGPGEISTSMAADGKGIQGGGSFFPCGVPYGIAPVLSRDRTSATFMIIDLESSTGLRRGEPLEQEGIFVSGIAETVFEHAPVGADAVLGSADDLSELLQGILREAWLGVGALAAGIGRGALEEVLRVVRKEQGAGRVSQVTEWKVADVGVEMEASELLVVKAAWLKARGKHYEKEAAAAKAFAAAAAVKASSEGLQILGNTDPGRRPFLEKHLRGAGMCQAYYGTQDHLGFVAADPLSRGRITAS